MAPKLCELEIKGVLNLSNIDLHFSEEYSVVVIQCPNHCPSHLRSLVSTALRLMYSDCNDEEAFAMFQKAYISLVFLTERCPKRHQPQPFAASDDVPCSSKSIVPVACNKIIVTRNFAVDKGRVVEYTINAGDVLHRCLWTDFRKLYFSDVDNVLPLLRELHIKPEYAPIYNSWQRGNWWQLLNTNIKNADNIFQQLFDLMEQSNSELDMLTKLTTSCLLALNAMNIIQNTQICKILQDVRRIFEYITCNEYTVWFLIPYNGELINLMDCTEAFEFKDIKTRIQLSNEPLSTRTYLWTNMEHVLQDLLLVAFQLAFAFNCKQQILYVQQLDRIAKRQSFHMALDQRLNTSDDANNKYSYNYLQRIIDVCNKMALTVIIEYPGGLPTKPTNANLIKYRKVSDEEYQVYVDKPNENTVQ